MIFETHAHYDDERFEEDRDALITSMPGRGVGTIINVGASIESTKTTLALSEKYPFVYAAVGVHPSDISGLNEETFAWLKEQTKKEKVAAVGEIGLDYYWDKEPEVQKQQRYWFAEQMKMAREASLPVIIHSRDAAADTMEVMKSVHAEEIPGVIHCYSYSKEMAQEFMKIFEGHSAAKTVHHGFIGGLMEHTLGVTRLCDYMANAYPVLNRDLLITTALLHDVGKTKELSAFPMNDYTDEGQLLGHIVIGAQMVHDLVKEIPDFPEKLENQVIHCILAHHGELEYGSPKKPALAEAVALNLADNTDARMETLTEIFHADKGKKEWLGFNRLFESNLRRTGDI